MGRFSRRFQRVHTGMSRTAANSKSRRKMASALAGLSEEVLGISVNRNYDPARDDISPRSEDSESSEEGS